MIKKVVISPNDRKATRFFEELAKKKDAIAKKVKEASVLNRTNDRHARAK